MRRTPWPTPAGPGPTGATYAGPARRIAAFGLDWLVISGYIVLLTGATLLVGRLLGAAGAPPDAWVINVVAFVTLILPVGLYFALLESGPGQATWGKRRLGLRVVTRAGGRLGRGRAVLRTAGKLLPWQLAHTCLLAIPGWPLASGTPPPWVFAGFAVVWLLVAADLVALVRAPAHRTPYDWLAGSEVVVMGSPPPPAIAPPGLRG